MKKPHNTLYTGEVIGRRCLFKDRNRFTRKGEKTSNFLKIRIISGERGAMGNVLIFKCHSKKKSVTGITGGRRVG